MAKKTPRKRRTPLPDPWERPTLPIAVVADLYEIGLTTAYEAVRSGRIPALRLGQRRVVVPTIAVWRALGLDPPPRPHERDDTASKRDDALPGNSLDRDRRQVRSL
jgi:hypothetical protein